MTALHRFARPASLADRRSTAIAAIGGLSALLVGFAIASGDLLPLAAVAGLVAGPLLLFDPALGVALWAPLPFIPSLPGAFGAERVASGLLLVAWLGLLLTPRGAEVGAAMKRQRTVLSLVAALVVMLGLSVVWAQDADLVGDELTRWYPAFLIFLVIATAVTDQRSAVLVVYGLAAGALLSVAIGLGMPQLASGHPSANASQLAEGRMLGAEGDANFLAAAIVPTAVLMAGLLTLKRDWLIRGVIVGSIVALVVGLVATQSRGGIVAALVALLATVALFRRRGGSVLWIVGIVLVVVAAAATASPEAYERLTLNDERAGSGRGVMWRMGYAISQDHPLLGVGLGNYVSVAPEYAREVGSITAGDLVVSGTLNMHNTFLQLLVEGGIFVLVAFTAIAWVCMRSALRAAGRFDASQNPPMATLARALVVAQASVLTASVFLPGGTDKRFWVLLALGPALENAAALRPRPAMVRAESP